MNEIMKCYEHSLILIKYLFSVVKFSNMNTKPLEKIQLKVPKSKIRSNEINRHICACNVSLINTQMK